MRVKVREKGLKENSVSSFATFNFSCFLLLRGCSIFFFLSPAQGFYDRDKLFWKEIADTMLIAGAAPPGGGRSEVTPRFVRHFNVFCVPQASTSAMSLIFSSMLKVKRGEAFLVPFRFSS